MSADYFTANDILYILSGLSFTVIAFERGTPNNDRIDASLNSAPKNLQFPVGPDKSGR
jgi:hypothetical protein